MKTFYKLLANNLIASITNMFVWFALTFYVYIETQSVLATSIIAGSWAIISAVFGLIFGTYVDHHKKKQAMLLSSLLSLTAFTVGAIIMSILPDSQLLDLSSIQFWVFVFVLLFGTIMGNMRTIAMSTSVTLLVEEDKHDKANGLVGSTTGIMFSLTSVFGGLGIGILGMRWSLVIACIASIVVILHLLTIDIPEEKVADEHAETNKRIDFKGAIAATRAVPGLLGLVFFATINNFLGGVFMALMDAYGLSLVSVEAWGILWGFLSLGFIVGGLLVAKRGLGKSPLRTLFMMNIIMWSVTIFFTVQASIVLMAIGMLVYITLVPIVEASEQTIIQKVVPLKKQGRVFGFAQTVEQAASPITTFLIGPIAQLFVIPFMSEGGKGAKEVGSWYGIGPARGLAVIFTVAGIVGLIITLLAMRTKSYRDLSKHYAEA